MVKLDLELRACSKTGSIAAYVRRLLISDAPFELCLRFDCDGALFELG